jgi:cysteine desulfurase / selenocysteine lyase
MDYRREFADFEEVAYLDLATQGPLPLAAARALKEATELKKLPHRISEATYFDLPDRIREKIGRLIGASPDEIALTTGASSGMCAVAAGIDWQPGDEVLVARGEFPAHFATWLPYQKIGKLKVRIVAPRDRFISADDYIAQITPRTRLVSASLVRFDNGSFLDAARVAQACHAANAGFLLDMSQCAAAMPLSMPDLGADFAVSSGYKWLLGPYGSGFFWVSRQWMERLVSGPFYWQALEGARDFHSLPLDNLRMSLSVRRWDSAETGSFIHLAALDASLDFLLRVGTAAIAKHNDALMSEIIERLPRDSWVLASPAERARRGPYVCVAARKPEKTPELLGKLREAQVIVALRENALRISSHLYNTFEHVDRLIKVLSTA